MSDAFTKLSVKAFQSAPAIQNLVKSYRSLEAHRESCLAAITCLFKDPSEKLAATRASLREAEKLFLESRVDLSEKTFPVDITTEYAFSIWDSLSGEPTDIVLARRANSKVKARKLLQKFHPDKADGDRDLFQLVRAAAQAGDLLLIRIISRVFIDTITDPDDAEPVLKNRLQVAHQLLESSPLSRLASLYFAGHVEAAREQLVNILEKRTAALHLAAMSGSYRVTTSENTENDGSEPTNDYVNQD